MRRQTRHRPGLVGQFPHAGGEVRQLRSRELVRTIVTMGLNLDLQVIAEGIETREELDLVRQLGCTHAQGYLYSRPVPAGECTTYLAGQRENTADHR